MGRPSVAHVQCGVCHPALPCPVLTLSSPPPDAILQEFFFIHFQYLVDMPPDQAVSVGGWEGRGGEELCCRGETVVESLSFSPPLPPHPFLPLPSSPPLPPLPFLPTPSSPPPADRSSNTSLLRCPWPGTALRQALWRHCTDLSIQVGNVASHDITARHHMTSWLLTLILAIITNFLREGCPIWFHPNPNPL